MDPVEYEHIQELSENGEFIDFEIPSGAPLGNRMSETLVDTEQGEIQENDLEPVDLSQVFGGGH